jgi:hypothetical protein
MGHIGSSSFDLELFFLKRQLKLINVKRFSNPIGV